MLQIFVVAVVWLSAVSAQYEQESQQKQVQQQLPKAPLPAILTHRQALSTDGAFNYAFRADNGLQQGETISPDGSRKGQYSYVDSNGQQITVRYTAGKDGFKVLENQPPQSAPPRPASPAYQVPQQIYQVSTPRPVYQQQIPYQAAQSPYPVQQPAREAFQAPSAYLEQQDPAPRVVQLPRPAPVQYQAQSPVTGAYQVPRPGPSAYQLPRPVPSEYQVPRPVPGAYQAPRPVPGPYQAPRPVSAPGPQQVTAPAAFPQSDQQDEPESQEPHTFGQGYSFEFQG